MNTRRTTTRGLGLGCLSLACWSFNALADESSLGEEWKPIDPARLDEMRGGFELPSGMNVSFGIERAVFANGQLVASQSIQIPDISQLNPSQAQALADFNQGLIVQVGEGNHVQQGPSGAGIVVQNTLDNQSFVTLTRLDVAVNSLGTFQSVNFSNLISDAMLTGISGP